MQKLLSLEIGAETFETWEAEMIELIQAVPPPIVCGNMTELPERPAEVIAGILRQFGVMLLSGAPKAGKSLMLTQLALCLSRGLPWLGKACRQCKVMIVNLEIDGPECIHRIRDSADALGVEMSDNLIVLNMDRSAAGLDELGKAVKQRAIEYQVEVIIIDPIYGLLNDETSATEVKNLVRVISAIRNETNTTIIFSHHNTKGHDKIDQSNHFNNISGSGVFARYPDALATLAMRADQTGTLRFTLRAFEEPAPLRVSFDYPVFVVDEQLSGSIGEVRVPSAAPGRPRKYSQAVVDEFLTRTPAATAADLIIEFGMSKSLAYDAITKFKKKSPYIVVDDPNIEPGIV